MITKLIKTLHFLVCAVLVVQLAGCGTIMYPERKGQREGRLDAGIVILDGIGLLFFLIPGIIAYAVDFSNGTIYLPGGHASGDLKNLKQVKFDPKNYTIEGIEKIIEKETGCAVKLNQDKMQISRLKSTDEMIVRFAEVLPTIKSDRIELSMK